ncbi:Rdx family protein [Microvirga sp. P5_D2]
MGQELLSTFGTNLDEVALAPANSGVFQITYEARSSRIAA